MFAWGVCFPGVTLSTNDSRVPSSKLKIVYLYLDETSYVFSARNYLNEFSGDFLPPPHALVLTSP